MSELKPCPFCGGEAETFLGWCNPEAQYGVRCKKCFSCTNPDNWEIWNHRPFEDKAVEVVAVLLIEKQKLLAEDLGISAHLGNVDDFRAEARALLGIKEGE